MTKNDIDKKKIKVLKTINRHLANTIVNVRDRSKRVLKNFPDSVIAMQNKTDCENALKTMENLYHEVKLENTKVPKNQLLMEDYAPLDDL